MRAPLATSNAMLSTSAAAAGAGAACGGGVTSATTTGFGCDQQKNQIHRTVIDGFKINRLFQSCEQAYDLAGFGELGVRDGLTGCFNRAHTLHVLQNELQRARRTGRPLSVLMFDIDHFKTINDTSGHLHGDAVLAAVGRQLNDVLRSTDVHCRYGGDEFLVILPDTSALGARQVAECLRREIADLPLSRTMPASVTVSLGVTAVLPGELDVNMVIARADEALYRAKRAGRNRFCLVTTGNALRDQPASFVHGQDVASA